MSGQLVLQVVHGDAGAAVLTDGNIELVQGISTFQNTARAWPVLNNSILGIKINFNLRAAVGKIMKISPGLDIKIFYGLKVGR